MPTEKIQAPKVAAHHGHVDSYQSFGRNGDFTWVRVDTKVFIICTGHRRPPMSVQVTLDEPWASEKVAAPFPFVPLKIANEPSNEPITPTWPVETASLSISASAIAEAQTYLDEDEEPTETYTWSMLPTLRNLAIVTTSDVLCPVEIDGYDDYAFISVEIQSLPDVKTKKEFDSTPPTKIAAGFQYLMQFILSSGGGDR
jgi:hypothetical protein